MTVIEIRPHRWGWKAFEAPGVEPVFPEKDQAIDYAQTPASDQVKFTFWIRPASLNTELRLANRIANCDCAA
jgi:hypothetical protein